MPRKQKDFENLSYFGKFLHHVCKMQGITQTKVWRKFNETQASPSTINRWFRGLAIPSESNLAKLSKYFNIPVEVFQFLQSLDMIDDFPNTSIFLTIPLIPKLLCSEEDGRLLLLGATMHAGTIHFREFPEKLKSHRITLVTAENYSDKPDSPLDLFEKAIDREVSGIAHLYWLASVASLIKSIPDDSSQVSIYTTDFPLKIGNEYVKHIVANEWVALLSAGFDEKRSNEVVFYGQERWNQIVTPLYERYFDKQSLADEDILVFTNDKNDDRKSARNELAKRFETSIDRLRSIIDFL